MRIDIHKLGGAALADVPAFRHAVQLLAGQPGVRVIVVSAMSGVTDALLEGASRAAAGDATVLQETAAELEARYVDAARAVVTAGETRTQVIESIRASFGELTAIAQGLAALRELTLRSTDHIVARGERLTARMMAAALASAGQKAEFVDALDVIACDETFGGAAPDMGRTDRQARALLLPMLRRGIVPVVPGFIGRTEDGRVATLGRGGTDLSATLLGRALTARSVTLWKDVPGLLTADPRLVPDARVIPTLSPREASELAYYGAKVLHPRALIPLMGKRIPLRIRPYEHPEAAGTEIVERRSRSAYPVQAISSVQGQSLITISGNGMLGVPGIAARTFAAVQTAKASVSLISQASSEHSICFSVPSTHARAVRHALEHAFADELRHRQIDGIVVDSGMATIAVVGRGMAGTPGIAARLFGALSAAGINIVAIAQGSSELNISCVVRDRDAHTAVRRAHAAFQLDRIGGGAMDERAHTDVILLGFGVIGRALARMISQANAGHRRLRVVGLIDRSGYTFDPRGLSPARLRDLVRQKERGQPVGVSDRTSARQTAGDAEDALRTMSAHALANPVLVDVTSDDTIGVLRTALEAGMHVVMANKRPLSAARSDALLLRDLASSGRRQLRFETTVGAGLPIIDTFEKLVETGDRVHRIEGCVSGTLGFVFAALEAGQPFSQAVKRAVSLGFAEPDPRDDLSGLDVARKALILGRLLGFAGELAQVALDPLLPPEVAAWSRDEFLARLPELDASWSDRVAAAAGRGRVLRYVASATRRRVTVRLSEVGPDSPFAALRGTDNQVVFTTDRYREHPLIITGPGAGPSVTAAGVLNDLMKVTV